MKRKGIFFLVAAGVVLFAVLAVLLLQKPVGLEKTERLSIGVFADSILALVYVGQEQGFFKRHGLNHASVAST